VQLKHKFGLLTRSVLWDLGSQIVSAQFLMASRKTVMMLQHLLGSFHMKMKINLYISNVFMLGDKNGIKVKVWIEVYVVNTCTVNDLGI
jgi:hypothetical protein